MLESWWWCWRHLASGRRLLAWLPMPLAMAMLAGSVMGDVINVIGTSVSDVAVAGSTVAAYVLGSSHAESGLRIGYGARRRRGGRGLMHTATPAPLDWTLPSLVIPQCIFGEQLPGHQLATDRPVRWPRQRAGTGYLTEQGYKVPADRVTLVLGLNTIVNAMFGGHTRRSRVTASRIRPARSRSDARSVLGLASGGPGMLVIASPRRR